MKRSLRVLFALATTLVPASMVLAGGVAYPSNWSGGAPLPPIGGYGQPMVQPGYAAQPNYGAQQPVYGGQPIYIPQRPTYYQPQSVYVARNTGGYGTAYDPYYSPGQGPMAGAVQGPPQARCVVSNLNGTRYRDGCGSVWINPADAPYLRQKFQNYQPYSGYALNLPSDQDFLDRR